MSYLRFELAIPDNDDDITLKQEMSTGTRRVVNHIASKASADTMATRPELIEILTDAVFLYTCYRWKLRKKSLKEVTLQYLKDYQATLADAERMLQAIPTPRSKRRSIRTRHDEEVPHIFSQSYGLGDFLP